jgi:hypothetical protein
MNKLPPQSTPSRNTRPVHEIRRDLIKAAIWANQTEEGIRHNVTFERRYLDGEEWKSTRSFGRDDMLTLAIVAVEARMWIVANTPRPPSDPDLQQTSLPVSAPSGPAVGVKRTGA